VTLNVSDGAGEFNSSQAALVVDPAQGTTGWTSRDTVLAAAAGVGAVAILAMVYWRRGSRRSPDSGDGPPTDTR
ncbi:MAG: hypothetical protein L3J80_04120, partial [Thermoplasmata archaeon]|nr:hypothetical protein [Thermoplasmata archaeon]